MKKLATLLLPLSLISTSVLADTKNFVGLSAGLNLNFISAGVKLVDGADSFDGLGGKQTQTAGVDAAYGYVPFGTNTVFTVGLDADLSNATVAEATVDGTTGTVKQGNRFGIYFAPGVVVAKETLIYGKVGYNQMKGTVSVDTASVSKNFRGVSYGAGTKIMISNVTFLKIEIGRYTFDSKTVDTATVKPSATVGTIGIGMRF